VTECYGAAKSPRGLSRKSSWIGDHEVYCVDVFNDLLKEEEKRGSEE
jgi:hypothetical protein